MNINKILIASAQHNCYDPELQSVLMQLEQKADGLDAWASRIKQIRNGDVSPVLDQRALADLAMEAACLETRLWYMAYDMLTKLQQKGVDIQDLE